MDAVQQDTVSCQCCRGHGYCVCTMRGTIRSSERQDRVVGGSWNTAETVSLTHTHTDVSNRRQSGDKRAVQPCTAVMC